MFLCVFNAYVGEYALSIGDMNERPSLRGPSPQERVKDIHRHAL